MRTRTRCCPTLTPEEAEQIALLDRVLALLLMQRHITALDIADTLGVSEATISHLRTNLQSYSFGRRQAANQLVRRLFAQAFRVLSA